MKAGKITEVQCKRSVLKQMPGKNETVVQGAGIGNDYAALRLENQIQMVTSMAVVTFKTAEPEQYAFWKALNQLETSGAVPMAVMVNLLLPARGKEERIRDAVRRISELCKEYQVAYIGGHTELLEDLRSPAVTVVAYGQRNSDVAERSIRNVQPNEDILMVGYTALETTAMLVKDKWKELNTRYAAAYLDRASAISRNLSLHNAFLSLKNQPITYIHDISTGGIFAALWELGEGAGCGIEVDLKAIPIYQETVEVCEFFDINPYMAAGGGSMLVVTPAGEQVAEYLRQQGNPVRIIGQTTERNDRIIINEDDTRYLTPPKGDDIYKIYMN